MSELDAFLQAIHADPHCRTAKAVLADWLEDHDDERWGDRLRNWRDELVFDGEEFDREDIPVLRAVVAGAKSARFSRCIFRIDGSRPFTFSELTDSAKTDLIVHLCYFDGKTVVLDRLVRWEEETIVGGNMVGPVG